MAGSAAPWIAGTSLAPSRQHHSVLVLAQATLPTSRGRFTALAFASGPGSTEHLALLHGRVGTAEVLVRIHSECLTGEILGSLRCDCGVQANLALGLPVDARGVAMPSTVTPHNQRYLDTKARALGHRGLRLRPPEAGQG
ncbi:MAG: hypothetical protein ACM3ML_38910 [Micromonosporaceae bacterium]